MLPHTCFLLGRVLTQSEAALAADQLPITALFLGDSTFGGAALVATYAHHGGWLLTPQQLPCSPDSWKQDLYAYRRKIIELLFQRIMQICDLKACPAKGLPRSGTFVVACVWLYIVALPFANLSKDPDQDYFSDGLTEVLTGDLSQLSNLFVIARNSAFTYPPFPLGSYMLLERRSHAGANSATT